MPGLKISSIDDSCGTDLERMASQPVDAVEDLLERDRDQGLDLGGDKPEADGLDLDPRRRELREDVHRHRRAVAHAEDHHARRRSATTR